MNATATAATKDFTKYGKLSEQAKRIWDLEQVMCETSNNCDREDEYDQACDECADLCREVRHRFLYDGVCTIDSFGECVCESARNGLDVIDIDEFIDVSLTLEFLADTGVREITVSISDSSFHTLCSELYANGWVLESTCTIEKDYDKVPAFRFVKRAQ